MDNESLIQKNIDFIVRQNIFEHEEYQSKKIVDKEIIALSSSQEIVRLFSSKLLFIADEVVHLFLAINEVQEKHGNKLMTMPGSSFFSLFPFCLIHPAEVYDIIDNYENDHEDYQHGIPIIHGDDRILFFTPILTEKAAQAPIYYKWGIDDPAELTLCYSSLTNLLLMVAEGYETGAYYFHKSGTYGSWQENFTKSEPIFHKYHPGLPFRSPHELSHFLDDYQT